MYSRSKFKDDISAAGCSLGCLALLIAPTVLWGLKGASDYVAKGPYSVSTPIRSLNENKNLGRINITYTRNKDNFISQFDLVDKVSIQLESEGKYLLSVNNVKSTKERGEDSLDGLVPVMRQSITLSPEDIKQPVTFDLREFKLMKDRSFFDVTRLNTDGQEEIQFVTVRL